MATKEQNEAFKQYLTTQGKDSKTATKDDALAFMDTQKPVSTNQPVETSNPAVPVETKPLIKTNLQTGQETIVGEIPKPVEPVKTVETPTPVIKEPTKTETKVEKPTTTTDITYAEDKIAYDPNKVISKAEQFTGADGKTYQTVRNSDNTLTTIDVTTGQPVTSKYTDTERDSIKQGFLKSPEQVQADQQKQVMQDPNAIYEQLKTGAFISKEIQNTPEYKKAYQRKQNLDKFSGMSATELATSIESGIFLPGTQVYDDLKLQNPKLVSDAEKQNSINSINKPKSDVVDIQTMMTEYLTKLMSDDEKMTYKETLAGNKDILKLNESLAESSGKLSEYKDQLEYLEEDINKDLEGRSVTKGYKNFIMGERNREISRLYNQELNKYNTTAGQIQTISEGIKYDMEEARLQEQTQMQNMQTALGMYQTMTADQRALDLNQKKLEQEYAYTYGDLNSENPTLQNIAIERAVADLYTKYPLPGMESQAMKVAKVKERMAQGMTGSEAIASLESEIRNTERYKNYINPQVAQTQDWSKFNDTTLFNEKTGEYKILTPTQSTTIDKPIGSYGGECGTYARQYTGIEGSLNNVVGATKEERMTNFTETEPKEGGLVFFTDGYNETYGHIAVVKSINGDGTMTITESNLKEDGKVTERTVGINEAYGFYNDTPLAKGGYTEQDIELLSELANMEASARNTALKSSGLTLKDVTDYTNLAKQGKIPATSAQKKSATGIMEDIKNLISMNDWQDAVGKSTIFPTIPGGEASSAENTITNLTSKLTLPNLGMLKGPMSDKDLAFLNSVSNKLQLTNSDEQFKKNLVELYNISARTNGMPEVKTVDEILKLQTATETGNEQDLFDKYY